MLAAVANHNRSVSSEISCLIELTLLAVVLTDLWLCFCCLTLLTWWFMVVLLVTVTTKSTTTIATRGVEDRVCTVCCVACQSESLHRDRSLSPPLCSRLSCRLCLLHTQSNRPLCVYHRLSALHLTHSLSGRANLGRSASLTRGLLLLQCEFQRSRFTVLSVRLEPVPLPPNRVAACALCNSAPA